MGKVLFALLLTTAISLGAQTPLNVIHSGCTDWAFTYNQYAYNQMDVAERGDSIYFKLLGSSVFNLTTDSWDSHLIVKSFKIKKSECRFSDNKRLIFCNSVSEVDVTVYTPSLEGLDKSSVVKVKGLKLEVRYFSSANPLASSGFELSTRYKVGDTDEYITNNTLFHGTRELGCTNPFLGKR